MRFFTSFRMTEYSIITRSVYVILSATKDLKACTAVHRHGDLEILHFVQNDSVFVIARLILSPVIARAVRLVAISRGVASLRGVVREFREFRKFREISEFREFREVRKGSPQSP